MQDSQIQQQYRKILDNKRAYLKKIYPLAFPNTWSKEAADSKVTIHSMYDARTGLKIIRANGKVKAPKEKIVKVADDVEVILTWDKTLEDVKLVDKTEDFYIIHTVVKKLPLIDQRETILLGGFTYDDENTILGVATSIEHPKVVKPADRVRATAYLVGWVLKTEPSNPELTDFTLILHINPEGLIPKTAFNWFAHNQGFNIAPFAEYCEKQHQLEKAKEEEKKKEEQKPEEEQKKKEEKLQEEDIKKCVAV